MMLIDFETTIKSADTDAMIVQKAAGWYPHMATFKFDTPAFRDLRDMCGPAPARIARLVAPGNTTGLINDLADGCFC
jgi:hypothetical protein